MHSVFRNFLPVLRRGMTFVTVLMLFYMLAAVALQVIGRALFNTSIVGSTETALMAQSWMVMLGTGIAMKNGQHVGLDVLVRKCPKHVQQIVSLIATVLCLGFLGVVFFGSLALIKMSMFQTGSATGLPMWIPYTALPVGSLYFALELGIKMWPVILGREISSEEVVL